MVLFYISCYLTVDYLAAFSAKYSEKLEPNSALSVYIVQQVGRASSPIRRRVQEQIKTQIWRGLCTYVNDLTALFYSAFGAFN
jgi:hypothetical protein